MSSTHSPESEPWRRCEIAWSEWLQSSGYVLFHLNEAVGNARGTKAPLMIIGGTRRRAPDLQATKDGISEFWEVKFRSKADFDVLTGERVHWAEIAVVQDYLAIAAGTRCRVWVVLFEGPTSTSSGRWLRADIRELFRRGRKGVRFDADRKEVVAWIWPSAAMDVVVGPAVELSGSSRTLLPRERSQHGVTEPTRLEPIQPQLKKRKSSVVNAIEVGKTEAAEIDSAGSLPKTDPSVSLTALCGSLGIPSIPRYSVLRIGLGGLDLDDVLGLLHYGIRLFLITESESASTMDPVELCAFKDSRLLEWAVIGAAFDNNAEGWVVDGAMPKDHTSQKAVLTAADAPGGINVGQYHIVHAPVDSDLLVTAGAGTGKTETMSERIVFLLATRGGADVQSDVDLAKPFNLRVDDIVLVTFTRDAAREMRQRISRTLMLRQRLCRSSVLPVLAWMMQLGGAEITTIHGYAKHLVQSAGGGLGLTPGATVGMQTLAFRKLLHEVLSPHLTKLIEKYPAKVPASHVWEDHLEAIWEALENNGVAMPVTSGSESGIGLNWGVTGSDSLAGEIQEITRAVITEVAARFRNYCFDQQSIRPSDLVPFALAALTMDAEPRVRKPRYLFVDEFQDTDALQMDLVLKIRKILDSRLFVVGDAKQGIYRFRGAEGNAFQELMRRASAAGLDDFQEFPLSRNFRSGSRLIDSLHPYFSRWGDMKLLVYTDKDKLRANSQGTDASREVGVARVRYDDIQRSAALQIARWRKENPKQSIAILCRRNGQASDMRAAVLAAGVPCELLVGGSFYRSPAVRELEVLLQAVIKPHDDAAILQLCETRWGAGFLGGIPPATVSDTSWAASASPLLGWRDRFGSLAASDSYTKSDLDQLRRRVSSVAALLSKMPVVAWIVECARSFVPEAARLTSDVDDSDRSRYSRCLDHLITLLDTNFKDGPASLHRVHSWLQLQIATNHSEDEPMERGELEGKTTALTVHKAKGLEFDRVLVPHTWTKFEPPKGTVTRVSVLRHDNELPRLIWEWNGSSNERFSNVTPEEWQRLWGQDDFETIREEARLLYVALTRAKVQLDVYVRPGRKRRGQPASWADLMLEAMNG